MADLGWHHARARLHLVDGIHIEIGKRSATHFRIGGVGAVERKDRRGPPLSIDRELLSEIRRPVCVCHGAG